MSDHNEAIDYPICNDVEARHATSTLREPLTTSVSRTHTVMNMTDADIEIEFKDGIPFKLRPQVRPKNISVPGVLVRLHYRVGNNVEIGGAHTLNAHTHETYSDVKALQDSVKYLREARDKNRLFDVDYFIPTKKMRELGGVFYVKEVDLLISTNTSNGIGPHPFSRLRDHVRARDAGLMCETTGFFYRLLFIDNEGVYGTHYVNVNGAAYAIRPIKNPSLPDGFHHYTPDSALGDKWEGMTIHTHVPTEEAFTKYGLYKTREEALTHGNSKEIYAAELADKKQELRERELEIEKERLEMNKTLTDLKSKHELEITKLKNETSVDDEHRERRLTELKMERDRLKDDLEYKQLHRKDSYDDRSHKRKDTSEILKFIPVALTAVAGVVGVMVGGSLR